MNRTIVHAIAFQGGWLACVAGGNPGAMAAALLLLPLHVRVFPTSARVWSYAFLMALLGLGVDLTLQRLGVLRFEHQWIAPIPPWLAVLWLLFALALFHSLAWLQDRPALAALLGALAGPLSYMAGLRLGAATTTLDPLRMFILMALAWALLLPALARLAKRGLLPAVHAVTSSQGAAS